MADIELKCVFRMTLPYPGKLLLFWFLDVKTLVNSLKEQDNLTLVVVIIIIVVVAVTMVIIIMDIEMLLNLCAQF